MVGPQKKAEEVGAFGLLIVSPGSDTDAPNSLRRGILKSTQIILKVCLPTVSISKDSIKMMNQKNRTEIFLSPD